MGNDCFWCFVVFVEFVVFVGFARFAGLPSPKSHFLSPDFEVECKNMWHLNQHQLNWVVARCPLSLSHSIIAVRGVLAIETIAQSSCSVSPYISLAVAISCSLVASRGVSISLLSISSVSSSHRMIVQVICLVSRIGLFRSQPPVTLWSRTLTSFVLLSPSFSSHFTGLCRFLLFQVPTGQLACPSSLPLSLLHLVGFKLFHR